MDERRTAVNIVYSEATIEWLQDLFCERLGAGLSFRQQGQQTVLSLHGELIDIRFSSDAATFSEQGVRSLSCEWWQAENEGFSSFFAKQLPMPGSLGAALPLVRATGKNGVGGSLLVFYDIPGLTYWMLSRQEEVGRKDLDAIGRFPATSSHAYRHGYLDRPIVDEWLDILRQVIRRVWPRFDLKQSCFQMRLSHDVDSAARYAFLNPFRLLRRSVMDSIRQKDLTVLLRAYRARAAMRFKQELIAEDPHNTYEWLMSLSEQYDVTSEFYFICGRTDPLKDGDYNIASPFIGGLLEEIHSRGHQIGLHPSYNSFREPDVIHQEFMRLRSVCDRRGIVQNEWPARMHYLRWRVGVTPVALEEAGIAVDATLAYADRPGFRCGTCHGYQAFDPVGKRALNLHVRPLVAMDTSVLNSGYLNKGVHDGSAFETFMALKSACRKVDGDFSLLWHNSGLGTPELRDLYASVLNA